MVKQGPHIGHAGMHLSMVRSVALIISVCVFSIVTEVLGLDRGAPKVSVDQSHRLGKAWTHCTVFCLHLALDCHPGACSVHLACTLLYAPVGVSKTLIRLDQLLPAITHACTAWAIAPKCPVFKMK